MTERNRYTTINLHEELKGGFESVKEGGETYNDVMRRALAALIEKEDRQKGRFEENNKRLRQQGRLLVRMADELGLDKEQFPREMAVDEAHGERVDPGQDLAAAFKPETDEKVTDVFAAEKAARAQAREEVLDQDTKAIGLDEDGEFPTTDEDGDPIRYMSGTSSEEEKAQIEQRTAEILAEQAERDDGHEQDSGWVGGFEDDGSDS